MDETAQLRELKPTITALQKAEKSARKKRFREAEAHARAALAHTPDDYAANVIMGKIQTSLEENALADLYFER
ncbi:MAG: peptidase M48 Ste24p, partial [Burkholderiales bacterium]|nr:peptidase M48 Ste24p [Burkholderiales bacterium]